MASLSESSGNTFEASAIAKWFHSAPHKDFNFDDTTTIFTPSDKSYNEALFLLAIFISSFGALIFILMILYYTCYFSCSCNRGTVLAPDLYKKRRSCLQHCIFIFAIICCGVVIMGFIFNGKASDGVDQFCNSVDNIQRDLNKASAMCNNAEKPLSDVTRNLEIIKEMSHGSIPDAIQALELVSNITIYLHNINDNYLPVDLLDRGRNFGAKVHRYDNYRWLVSVGLYTCCVFLCVFCFWSYCQITSCTMMMLTIFSFFLILFSWAVLGAHFGIATGVGDFCVNPNISIKQLSHSSITTVVIDYYMKCSSDKDPFYSNFHSINTTLMLVRDLTATIGSEHVRYWKYTQEIKVDLNEFSSDLSLYKSEFACTKIHKEYMDGMDALCNKALTGLAIIILSFLVIGFISGILTFCICPLWLYRKSYHQAYPNSANSRGDGNAVLWWPDNLNNDRDENNAHGRINYADPERVPFMSDQPSSNYRTLNHSNLDNIQTNTAIPHTSMDSNGHSEGPNNSQYSSRHSF